MPTKLVGYILKEEYQIIPEKKYVVLVDDLDEALDYFFEYHPWNTEERNTIKKYKNMLIMRLGRKVIELTRGDI
jgi:hypothetical protein